MDRSEFFNLAWKHLAGKAVDLVSQSSLGKSLDDISREKHYPPGASLPNFLEKCTGCDACMIACPVNVIMVEDLIKRVPVIYPKEAPCIQCEGYPCIQACSTGALSRINLVSD